MSMQDCDNKIKVLVESQYIAEKSVPEENRFVFGYHVTIQNHGNTPTQIQGRHWFITDADGETEEIRGPGVVGEKPWIDPGEDFKYVSGAVLKTPVGAMHGHYDVATANGEFYKANIPAFSLSMPDILH